MHETPLQMLSEQEMMLVLGGYDTENDDRNLDSIVVVGSRYDDLDYYYYDLHLDYYYYYYDYDYYHGGGWDTPSTAETVSANSEFQELPEGVRNLFLSSNKITDAFAKFLMNGQIELTKGNAQFGFLNGKPTLFINIDYAQGYNDALIKNDIDAANYYANKLVGSTLHELGHAIAVGDATYIHAQNANEYAQGRAMYEAKAIQFAYDGIAELKAANSKLNLTAQEAGYVFGPKAEIFYQSRLAGIDVTNDLVNHIKSSSPAPSLYSGPDLTNDGVVTYWDVYYNDYYNTRSNLPEPPPPQSNDGNGRGFYEQIP